MNIKEDKRKLEESSGVVEQEFFSSFGEFLERLEDMKLENDSKKNISGAFEGPYGSKTEYGCIIRFGLNAEDFPLTKSFCPRQRPKNHTLSLRSGEVTK